MFYFLLLAAALFFVAHVVLLFTAFPKSRLKPRRYFYSHLTLWITGTIVFMLAFLFSGTGRSGFLDYFDTTTKRVYILIFTIALSFVAHLIVTKLVVPLLNKNK